MISILGAAIGREEGLGGLRAQGEFRKSTRNMMLAWLSIEAALAPLGEEMLRGNLADFSFVLGSSYGELETTKDFLRTLAEQRIARPLLFQNSLHHSTTGFLAVKLALACPSFTVSGGVFTGEDCLLTAIDLIQGRIRPVCIVTTVEGQVPELTEALEKTYPPGVALGEGAATLIVADPAWARRHGLRSRAVLDSLRLCPERRMLTPEELASRVNPHYDANALERFCLFLESEAAIATQPDPLILTKPDGRESVFTLRGGNANDLV